MVNEIGSKVRFDKETRSATKGGHGTNGITNRFKH